MSDDLIRKGTAPNVIFNRAILDKAVRLRKSGKEADCLAAVATEETPDEDEQSAKAHPAQIAAVVAHGPKCFWAETMRTSCGWPHPFVETFGDILFWINIDGVDQLHDQLRRPLRILIRSYFLSARVLRQSLPIKFLLIFHRLLG